jgi:hypothetical protein
MLAYHDKIGRGDILDIKLTPGEDGGGDEAGRLDLV